jgi:hypothetical protein
VEEVTDEPLYRDRVCGTGTGKAGTAVTVRVPPDRDPSRRPKRDPSGSRWLAACFERGAVTSCFAVARSSG